MIVDAISFEVGGFPSVELHLASSVGLAPLQLPQSLPQPPQDAVSRFMAAMEDDDGEPLQPGLASVEKFNGGLVDAWPTSRETHEATVIPANLATPDSPATPDNSATLINQATFVRPEIQARPETQVVRQSENPVNPVKENNPAELNPVKDELPVRVVQDFRASAPLREMDNDIVDASAAPSEEVTVPRRDVFQTGLTGFTRLEIPEAVSADTSRTLPISQATIGAPAALAATPANPAILVTPEIPASPEITASPEAQVPSGIPVFQEIPASPKAPVVQQTENPANFVNSVNPVKENNPTELSPVKEELPVRATQDLRASAFLRETGKNTPDAENVVAKAESASAHVVISPSVIDTAAAQQVPNNSVSAVSSAAASARTDAIVETVNKIVESVAAEISVTPSMVKGEETVHITLKPTVLDGSEITLSAKDGTLTVAIASTTPQAEQAAAVALPRLEIALAEHIPAFQQFVVVLKKGKSNETA